MIKRLLLGFAFVGFIAQAQAADTSVPNMTASSAIVGAQLTYCPTTTPADFKCTFTQVDAFINAQFSGDFTVSGTGLGTLASVITAGGPTGSATVVPIITYDAKGRLTTVTSATIAPAIGSVTGLGTGVATALGVNVGTAGAPVVNGGAGGTPSSLTLTNALGLPAAAMPALTGDVTTSAGAVATTLKNTGPGATGPIGSTTVTPVITIDAQGRVTALTQATIAGGGGTPGGANTNVQFNNSSAFGGDSGFTYAGNGQVAITDSTANTTPLTISGGSATGSSTPKLGLSISNTINSSAAGDGIDIFANTTATQNPAGTLLVDLQVGGAQKFNVDTSGNISLAGAVTTQGLASFGNLTFSTNTAGLVWTGRGAITSEFSQNINLGGADSASPSAQFLTVGSVAAGNGNVAGVNWTMTGSRSNGSGLSGDIIYQTGGTGAASGSENTAVTALIIKGATQAIQMPLLASSSVAQTGTVCWTTGTGNLTVDTTTTCLLSLEELKDKHGPILHAMDEITKLEPFWYTWKEGTPERAGDTREQPGLGAHQVESVDPRLAGYGTDGSLHGVRYAQMVALLVAGMKELKADNDNLRAEVHQLERRKHRR